MLDIMIAVFLGIPLLVIIGLVIYVIVGGAIWHCIQIIRTEEIGNVIAGSLGLSLIVGMILLVCKLFIEFK